MIKTTWLALIFLTSAVGNTVEKKIVIIGGGLSGLTTAYRLIQNGKNVELYEARDRPGGRVLTLYFADSYEEIGAKFISDGGEAKNLKTLIREMGLEIQDYTSVITDRKYYYKGETGSYYTPFKTTPLPNEELYEQLKSLQKISTNMQPLLNTLFAGKELACHLTEIHMRGYYGSDSKVLSADYFDRFWQHYQKTYAIAQGKRQHTATHATIKGGNSLLPLKLAAALGERIHFNHPVVKIGKAKEGKIELYFKNGKKTQADILVLAIPYSTLRDIKMPKKLIPENQWEAIKTMQYGSNSYLLMNAALHDETSREYSVTEDAIVWFNHDQKIITLDLGGHTGDFRPTQAPQVIKRELPALKKLFPSFNYQDDYRVMCWLYEEYSKGSYSNRAAHELEIFNERAEYAGEIIPKVFYPIEDRIFFSSDDSDLNHPGTMEGAVASGETTSRMIQSIIE